MSQALNYAKEYSRALSDIPADVNNPAASIEKFAMLMNEKYGKLLPKGYVFRVATEAEYEYVSKAGVPKGDPRLTWGYSMPNISSLWGVEDMFRSCVLVFQDKVSPLDWDRTRSITHREGHLTILERIDYSKQPSKDPIMWCNERQARYLRRALNEDAQRQHFKIAAAQDGSLCGSLFYLVAAPNVNSLNKFVLK